MSKKTLALTLKRSRMGWCLFVDGVPYAVGSQAYCIAVANGLRKGSEVAQDRFADTLDWIHSGGRRRAR